MSLAATFFPLEAHDERTREMLARWWKESAENGNPVGLSAAAVSEPGETTSALPGLGSSEEQR
jgi:hypothetical protein